MEFLLFKDLIVIFGFSIIMLLIGFRLKIPPVVGFILTGVLAGPHGLSLVSDIKDVDILAELGIVLLLFGIGMEFSLKKLVQIKRLFLLGGSLQVGLTIALVFLISSLFSHGLKESIFWGCVLSMSSTAVVLGILDQKGESATPHGKISIAILIFQDMITIPMLLLFPLLGAEEYEFSFSAASFLPIFKALFILGFVFFAAQKIVPKVLFFVAKTRNKELFLLSVLMLCFGVAWLTSSIGLSLTIGAFLAGLIISESEYSNEAISHIFPFQALFISFFFVSIGMLLDLDFVWSKPLTVLFFAIGIMAIKCLAAGLCTLILGLPLRTAIFVGIALSQIGEFSFVLAKTGIPLNVSSESDYQLFLSASLFTLLLSPLAINLSPFVANWMSRFSIPEILKNGWLKEEGEEAKTLENHVLIIGFGISGKNLAKSCKLAGIPYVIMEMNPDTVKEQKKLGEPIHFGDATHLSILKHLYIDKAKSIAVLINDPLAARRIVQIAHNANPSLYIIVRTRYVQEMSIMNRLGADEVIPDEFGTSIEIFSRVLRQYHVPDEDIQACISQIRADGYELFKTNQTSVGKLSDIKLNLSNIEVASFKLHSSSSLVGKLLSECQLRNLYDINVLLIRRGEEILSNPNSQTKLLCDDVVTVVGNKLHLTKMRDLFGHI